MTADLLSASRPARSRVRLTCRRLIRLLYRSPVPAPARVALLCCADKSLRFNNWIEAENLVLRQQLKMVAVETSAQYLATGECAKVDASPEDRYKPRHKRRPRRSDA